jgi:hypothetical protein
MDLTRFRNKRLFPAHQFFNKHSWVRVREVDIDSFDIPDRLKYGMRKWLKNKKNRDKKMYLCSACHALGETPITRSI